MATETEASRFKRADTQFTEALNATLIGIAGKVAQQFDLDMGSVAVIMTRACVANAAALTGRSVNCLDDLVAIQRLANELNGTILRFMKEH